MYKLSQIWKVALANFRRWKRNPQIFMAFALGFIISFLLVDKVLTFVVERDTNLQVMEPFIWTFGDANSILIISLVLLLLFADMPNIKNEVPFFLIRIDRSIWLLGQILYMTLATLIFVTFVFLCTCLLSQSQAYPADLWSETAAVLGYSNIGKKIAVPAFVKVLERTFPYICSFHIFALITGYSLFLSSLILFLNLFKGKGGMIGGIIFSVFGFVMDPQLLSQILKVPADQMFRVNIIFGWISPLNHATYYMHNYGYDNLPRLWVSYLFFALGTIMLSILSLIKIRNYHFSFTGTSK